MGLPSSVCFDFLLWPLFGTMPHLPCRHVTCCAKRCRFPRVWDMLLGALMSLLVRGESILPSLTTAVPQVLRCAGYLMTRPVDRTNTLAEHVRHRPVGPITMMSVGPLEEM